MNFPCPKCNARTELADAHIPEEGTSAKCPECKARFWIARESFARRAVRKEGKALCCHCNNELSNYLDCPTCGAMYPEICVVQMSKPVKKKQRRSSAAIGFSIRPQRKTRTFVSQPAQRSSKSLLTIIVLLVIVALAGAAITFTYINSKTEKAYTEGFFRALYGLKMGADLDFKQCATLTAAARTSGQSLNLLITDKDKAGLNSAKSDVTKLMERVPKPPQKFSKVNDSLAKLYGIYLKTYDLASSPSGTMTAYADASAKLENEFRQAGKELKGNLTAEMAEEFKQLAAKYKQLEDL